MTTSPTLEEEVKVQFEGTELDFNNIDDLLQVQPPGAFFRRIIKIAEWMSNQPVLKHVFHYDAQHSITVLYEAALTKYRDELMARPDLPKHVRGYVERYVLRN